jgi:hypothetical protein
MYIRTMVRLHVGFCVSYTIGSWTVGFFHFVVGTIGRATRVECSSGVFKYLFRKINHCVHFSASNFTRSNLD